jgi:hypothetical protein
MAQGSSKAGRVVSENVRDIQVPGHLFVQCLHVLRSHDISDLLNHMIASILSCCDQME